MEGHDPLVHEVAVGSLNHGCWLEDLKIVA